MAQNITMPTPAQGRIAVDPEEHASGFQKGKNFFIKTGKKIYEHKVSAAICVSAGLIGANAFKNDDLYTAAGMTLFTAANLFAPVVKEVAEYLNRRSDSGEQKRKVNFFLQTGLNTVGGLVLAGGALSIAQSALEQSTDPMKYLPAVTFALLASARLGAVNRVFSDRIKNFAINGATVGAAIGGAILSANIFQQSGSIAGAITASVPIAMCAELGDMHYEKIRKFFTQKLNAPQSPFAITNPTYQPNEAETDESYFSPVTARSGGSIEITEIV